MTNGKNAIQHKNYSRFTSNAAKNIVKKKLFEIRKNGARAADELIDQLLKNDGKTRDNGLEKQSLAEFELVARSEIEKSRGKWRNFIIEAAMSFDPDALACFGVNFIYGGIMTSSVGNSGWASVIELGEYTPFSAGNSLMGSNKSAVSSNRARALSEIIAKGRARGNMVRIIKGRGLFEPDMLKTYQFEPDIAFILLEEPDKNGIWQAPMRFEELSRLKNVLTVIPDKEISTINEFGRRGMLYAVSSFDQRLGEGNCGGFSANISRGSLPPELDRFIKQPSFPIRADGIIPVFNGIEALLSSGKSDKIPVYRL